MPIARREAEVLGEGSLAIVERAADLCPVSNALRGNVTIDVRTELEALIGVDRGA
jgi:organic hydroperoxide reductase OsmC/OhrA